MTRKAHGQLRRAQVITTYGPGALIDLPKHSAIVGGLDGWPNVGDLEEIAEPRLTRLLELLTGVSSPPLYAPPSAETEPGATPRGIVAWRFPEWFVVQDEGGESDRGQSRRLVHRKGLDNDGRFDGKSVVATRFVRACPKGHVDDIDWQWYVHGIQDGCRRPLWLDERGTGGDLGDLTIRCECGKSKNLALATHLEDNPLGSCKGRRPWLGAHSREDCNQPSRLLIRTASNSYFSQVVSVLSLPERGGQVDNAVVEVWSDLNIVQNVQELAFVKKHARVAAKLAAFSDDEVMKAIERRRKGRDDDRHPRHIELDALVAASEGFGDDVPIDQDFHARRLPDASWRRSARFPGIEAVVQLHRLREVEALIGFTRFEAAMPNIHGEYDTDVERAAIATEPTWFPAVENRGEGVFVQLNAELIGAWLRRDGVKTRLDALHRGHERWAKEKSHAPEFPGGPYILLHTLSHLLIQSVAMRCGYPASSIGERVYVDIAGRYGVLLYTGSPDAEGTLGGLVQQARYLEDHLLYALGNASLCSNDPICAHHRPGESMEGRWLHGAACHGCALIAETSCEMRNDYLDRALVVPALGCSDAAFFASPV